MVRPTRAALAVVSVLAGAAAVARGADDPARAAGEDRALARAHTARIRVEPTWQADAGACLDYDVEDLRIRLRGEPIDDPGLIDLDRELRPTVHAVMLDTSGSMGGKLQRAREAAAGYLRTLDPGHERGMLVTFDDSALLAQPATADVERLVHALDDARLGSSTSMLAALHDTIRELETHRERPVLLLVGDGLDSASIEERGDVLARAARRRDLAIFTIGLDVPPMTRNAPTGYNSTKTFLLRLAERNDGRYFDAPTAGRLDRIYARIREMLDSEARLTVIDPDPSGPPGRLKIGIDKPGCTLRRLTDDAPLDATPPVPPSRPTLPATLNLPGSEIFVHAHLRRGRTTVEPDCHAYLADPDREPATIPDGFWRATVDARRVHGCALDVTLDVGLLYDPYGGSSNGFIEVRTRPFEIELPPPDRLPERPEQTLDRLAATAVATAEHEIERNFRKLPAWRHARPFHDQPGLLHGRAFFDLRPRLATAFHLRPDYRAWAERRLAAEADHELAELAARFRRRAPRADDAAIARAVAASDEGARIRRRAATPGEDDLQRHLAAWLGDIPAHELFVRWEIAHADARLTGAGSDDFPAAWSALRALFWAPSYARVLTLLAPVHDAERDRIGYWRVVLPRPALILSRVKGYRNGEYADPPLDLLPDRPLGYEQLERLLDDHPALATHLASNGYRVVALRYALLGKPRFREPRRAYRHTRVELDLAAGEKTLRLAAELGRDDERAAFETLRLDLVSSEDPVLAELVRTIAPPPRPGH